jgi:hypothetical protein
MINLFPVYLRLRMKKIPMSESFRCRNKGTKQNPVQECSSTQMRDAGMPEPAASASMPMPSYGFTVSAIFEEIPPTKKQVS